MNFGERLIEVRENLGFNQAELANKMKMAAQNLGRYEKNKVKPSIDFLITLTYLFNINSNWLLTGIGKMFTEEDNLERINIPGRLNFHFSEKEIEIFNNFRELDKDEQEIFYLKIKLAAAEARKKAKDSNNISAKDVRSAG